MVDYTFLWQTMERKHISSYKLRQMYNISSSTLTRLKNNENVSTNTLDILCKALNCQISEIVFFS